VTGQDARTARLLVGFAAVLGVLLALVALASRGATPDGGRDGPLAPGAVSWLYAVFVVAGALALPLFAYIYTREVPYSEHRRRRARMMPFLLVGVATALLVIAVRSPDSFAEAVSRLRLTPDDDTNTGADARQPPPLELFPLMVVSSAVLAGAAALAVHRLVRKPRAPGRTLPEALAETLDESLDDLRAEPDPRLAVVRAWARMETALERCGVPRHEAEAPLEYVARVLLQLEVRPGPVHELTALFERARFSRHEIGPDTKEEAIAALETIRDELRGLA
jgi:hypothetical protein